VRKSQKKMISHQLLTSQKGVTVKMEFSPGEDVKINDDVTKGDDIILKVFFLILRYNM
jgi:hypothetical protein